MQTDKSAVQTLNLRPNQREHFKRVLNILSKFYFCVDGSEMGTGKTYVAAAIAITLKLPAIVFCPLSARKTWQDVFTTYGVSVYNLPGTCGIISYDDLRAKKGYQPNHGLLVRDDTGTSTVFYPTTLLVDIIKAGVLIIFDECQKTKNASGQNKASKALIRQIYAQGGNSRVALLSASALDKEIQVVNLLKMVGFITSRNLYSKINGEFRLEGIQELYNWSRLINPAGTKAFLDRNPSPTNTKQATKHVFDLFIEVLKPGLMSIMPRPKYNGRKDVKNGYYVLSPEDDLKYQAAISQLSEAVRYNPETGSVVQKGNMGAITKALICGQEAKMRTMVRLARETLLAKPTVNEKGENLYPKITLYADYYPVIDFLLGELKEFKPLELTGRVKEKVRNANISKFQEANSNYRLLIANPLVGGLSVNLHDTDGHFPRTTYMMPGYKINELHQATGRTFRDGIEGDAKIRFLYGLSASSIRENSILNALSRKGEVMQKVHSEQSDYGMLFPNQYENYYEVDTSTVANGPLVNSFQHPSQNYQTMINQATTQMQTLSFGLPQ